MIDSELHSHHNYWDNGFIVMESLQISSKTRIAEYNDLPHEAPHILKIADECLAKVYILCSRHIFRFAVGIVCNDIKDV